jgi:predicted  nucleic acid-binding Zn-ribbon protein
VATLRRKLDEQKVNFRAELRTVMQNGEADAAVASMEAFSHASQAAEARLNAVRKELTGKLEESKLEAEALRRALAEARKRGEKKSPDLRTIAAQTTQVESRVRVNCVSPYDANTNATTRAVVPYSFDCYGDNLNIMSSRCSIGCGLPCGFSGSRGRVPLQSAAERDTSNCKQFHPR